MGKTVYTNLLSILRYILLRGLAVGVSLVLGIYLTIWVANMGGYVDEIRRAEIREQVGAEVLGNPSLRRLPQTKLREIIDERVRLEEIRLGLDEPFFLRSFEYLARALSLNLGRAEETVSETGSKQVWIIIKERLPPSVMLFTSVNLLLFFAGLFAALALTRRHGGLVDKLTVGLAPASAAPPWFYGLLLIMVFAGVLKLLPFGGMVDPELPTGLGYGLSVLKHMILPALAILVAEIFITVYNWRTFFLIFSGEDYIELAKAKGIPSRAIERRYILRPTLPTIITQFALMLIASWMGMIITERVFNWPGLGSLYYEVIGKFDTPVIVGLMIIYAYLLAITVFVLDIIYAIVDPRVKVGKEREATG